MKTKVEVLGYEIEIEEVDGVVTVKAELDGETVEEFTLETPEEGQGQDEEDDDVKGFKDFDGQEEEEDFGDEESEGQDDDDDDDDDDDEKALESFQSFFNKR
jgi:hypothetical protein